MIIRAGGLCNEYYRFRLLGRIDKLRGGDYNRFNPMIFALVQTEVNRLEVSMGARMAVARLLVGILCCEV